MNKREASDVPPEQGDIMVKQSETDDPAKRTARQHENDIDRALVERARKGDRLAFGELVERHQRRVYALAYGILRQREDAWDAAQEAFVKAYKNLDRFEGSSAFYTWLYRITYNLSIDHLREKGRRARLDLDENRDLEAVLEENGQPSFEAHPDAMADRRELSVVLHQAMSKLSEKHRAIIVLREVEGLSYEEIADVLGISKGTVMSRLFHARQNLQLLLKPYVAQGEGVPASLKLAAQGT